MTIFRMPLSVILSLFVCVAARAEEAAETSSAPPQKAATQKTLWTAHILRERNPEAPHIAELIFPNNKMPVLLVARPDGLRPLIEMEGRFYRPGWTLHYADGSPVAVSSENGDFKIYAHLNARVNQVMLFAKGPKGEVESERVFVFSKDAQEFRLLTPWDALVLSVGGAYMRYSQTGSGDFRSVSGLLSVQYNHPESASRYGFTGRLDATVITLDSTPIKRGPQLVQAKLNGTYRWHEERERPWHIHLLLGPSYWTMFSHGSPFGFSNLLAVEGGVRARYSMNAKVDWNFEARYAPIKISDSKQRGYDLSLCWSKILSNLHRLEAGVGYSDFGYRASPSMEVHASLLTLRLGYSL